MNMLVSKFGSGRLTQFSRLSSPPTREAQSCDPVDVYIPSDSIAPTSESKAPGYHKMSVAQVAIVGLGAVSALIGTVHAAASTETVAKPEAVTESIQAQAAVQAQVNLAKEPAKEEEPAPAAPVFTERSYGQTLNDEQKGAVDQIVTDLAARGFRVKTDDVINFMATETNGTFDPSIRSLGKKGGAVGLAQFTQTAINAMNRTRGAKDKLTKTKLAEMTFTEQSQVVTDYLSSVLEDRGMKGKEVSGADLYAAVFAPSAVGRSMNSTVYSKGAHARYYKANKSLDTNRDGRISKQELVSRLEVWAERGADLRG